MSYTIDQESGKVFIPAADHQNVYENILRLIGRERRHTSQGSGWKRVASNDLKKATNLTDAMRVWRWNPEYDVAGNIISLKFLGEILGDDIMFFRAIAPWVSEGSSIEVIGEDGRVIRWWFNGQRVLEQEAQLKIKRPPSN